MKKLGNLVYRLFEVAILAIMAYGATTIFISREEFYQITPLQSAFNMSYAAGMVTGVFVMGFCFILADLVSPLANKVSAKYFKKDRDNKIPV